MADEAEVIVPEEGVVEVDIGDEKAEAAEPVEKEKPLPRIRPKDPAPAPDEATDALKAAQAAVDNEKRLRQAAEQTATAANQRAEQEAARRQTREQELAHAQENLAAREMASIEAGIAGATREVSSAQKELSSALAEGNFEKVAEVQTRLSRATATLDRLEDKKANYEAGQQTRTPMIEGSDQQPTVQGTPFDRYISGMEPAAQTWLRAHSECAPSNVGGKADMNSKMMRGHYDALAQGFAPNSDNYFRVIEESTGYRKPAVAVQDAGEEPQPKPKPKVKLSAPPSHEPPGSPPTGGARTVRLTKEQQEAARFSFPNLEPNKAYAEYAKNYVALDTEGKLGRTSH